MREETESPWAKICGGSRVDGRIQVEKNCRTQHVPPNFALSRIQIPFVAEKRRGNEFPQREVAPLSEVNAWRTMLKMIQNWQTLILPFKRVIQWGMEKKLPQEIWKKKPHDVSIRELLKCPHV